MARRTVRRNSPVSNHLHPVLYKANLVFALWFVLSAWGFARSADSSYIAAIVTAFIAFTLAVTYAVSRIWRHSRDSDADGTERVPLRRWAAREFGTWPGRIKGAEAAVEAILPVAAVAFGMTAFAIILHLAIGSVH